MVSGRLINGYSTKDLVLAFVYRYEKWKVKVSGIEPVHICAGIENVDFSAIVEGHGDYGLKMKEILQIIDLKSTHTSEVMSQFTPEQHEESPVATGITEL